MPALGAKSGAARPAIRTSPKSRWPAAPGRGSGPDPQRLLNDTLKQIANMTRANYFYAGTASDLKKVYENLNSRLVLEKKETEVTALFVAAAAVLALVSAVLSLLWFNRIL